MNNNQSHHINSLIKAALQNCDQLSAKLKAEKSALIAGDMVALKKLIDDKIDLLSQLTSQDTELKELISNASQAEDTATIKNWKTLQSNLEQCKYLNSVNGAMINHSLKNTSDALNLLRGDTVGDAIYCQDGKTNRPLNSKKIATI